MSAMLSLIGAGLLLVLLLICVQRGRKVVQSLQPIHLNATATGFDGSSYENWRVTTVTGQVAAASVRTYGTIHYTSGQPTAAYSTSVRDRIRLIMDDGRQEDLQLHDFDVSPEPGDVVTICYASNGLAIIVFAVLNHTTRRQFINAANLQTLLHPESGWGLLGGFAMIAISIFSGLSLFFVVLALWMAVGFKKGAIRRDFVETAIPALWALSSVDAEPFLIG